MAITQAMTTSFKVDLLSGGMNFNTTNRALSANTVDAFRIGLYSASTASLDATTTAYTNTGEITGTGYTNTGVQSTSGQSLTFTGGQNATSTGTVAWTNFGNAVWSSATFSADGALIWNASNSGRSVCVLSFGGTKTVSSGTFTVQMPGNASGTALIQIA